MLFYLTLVDQLTKNNDVVACSRKRPFSACILERRKMYFKLNYNNYNLQIKETYGESFDWEWNHTIGQKFLQQGLSKNSALKPHEEIGSCRHAERFFKKVTFSLVWFVETPLLADILLKQMITQLEKQVELILTHAKL